MRLALGASTSGVVRLVLAFRHWNDFGWLLLASALIGIAPPVTRYDYSRTLQSDKAKFFVQGDLDEHCPLKDLRRFYSALIEPKELVVIDGANHLFEGKTGEVGEALEDLVGDFETPPDPQPA